MKIFCTLLWAAILAITVKRCGAEFLLVEVDDAAEKSARSNNIARAGEIEELAKDDDGIGEAGELAEAKRHVKPQILPGPPPCGIDGCGPLPCPYPCTGPRALEDCNGQKCGAPCVPMFGLFGVCDDNHNCVHKLRGCKSEECNGKKCREACKPRVGIFGICDDNQECVHVSSGFPVECKSSSKSIPNIPNKQCSGKKCGESCTPNIGLFGTCDDNQHCLSKFHPGCKRSKL